MKRPAADFAQTRGLIVVAALAVTGVAIGALWAWLAPPVHGVVALTKGGDRVRAHLGNEADHFFVAAFMMVGMLCARPSSPRCWCGSGARTAAR